MATGDRVRELSDLEAAVSSLNGVQATRILPGSTGLESVQVVVEPGHSIEDTIRGVQALAISKLDAPIERSRVEVISAPSREAGTGNRGKLFSLVTERSEARFTARVAITLLGSMSIGESHAPAISSFEWRCIALATLEALRDAAGCPVQLEAVDRLSVGDTDVAAVVVSRGPQVLVGSALVKLDDGDAIARATLDALNRFLGEPHPADG